MLGFGESIAGLLGFGASPWAVRGFAGMAVLLLSVINLAGVKWVIKLQFMLLLILLSAGLDFAVGTFVKTDRSKKSPKFKKNSLYFLDFFQRLDLQAGAEKTGSETCGQTITMVTAGLQYSGFFSRQ